MIDACAVALRFAAATLSRDTLRSGPFTVGRAEAREILTRTSTIPIHIVSAAERPARIKHEQAPNLACRPRPRRPPNSPAGRTQRADVCELVDLYLAEGAGHKKASTLKADGGRIEHHLRPVLGKLRADRIGRAEIERMRNAVAAGKTAMKVTSGEKRRPGSIAVGGKGAAAQCVALVSSIYAFAISRGVRVDNPARGVKKAPVRKLERFLTEAEIARLGEVLDVEAQKSGNPYPSAAIRLLLLTGCRKSEITNLRWDHVDFERECLRLPDSKTGAKVVYLNAPAREVLHELPRMAHSPQVIPAMRGDNARPAIDKVWSRVRRAAALTDVRLHDLRHSFASVGVAGGLSLPIIGALLGHKDAATTARYAHLSADPLRAANDAVGARIAAAMSRGVEADAIVDIVALPSRKGDAA